MAHIAVGESRVRGFKDPLLESIHAIDQFTGKFAGNTFRRKDYETFRSFGLSVGQSLLLATITYQGGKK